MVVCTDFAKAVMVVVVMKSLCFEVCGDIVAPNAQHASVPQQELAEYRKCVLVGVFFSNNNKQLSNLTFSTIGMCVPVI